MTDSQEKWIISLPGGPAGPFWSIVSSSGTVIVLQITEEKYAKWIQKMGNAINTDFTTIHLAGRRLRRIIDRDIKGKNPLDKGAEDYMVRAVVEALFLEIKS